ncbi:MAG: hypothetical protein LLF89_06625, partial [Spirochaetaceae bacterium]|nr:hypothetical protein [Spirochaetaceae bacterium]
MKRKALYIVMLLVAMAAGAQVSQGTQGTGTTAGSGTAGSALQGVALATGASQSPASISYTVPEPQTRALMAMATPDYPVTVGDIYTLSFMRSYQQENISLMVQGDGLINAGYFGRIQTQGMSFRALKEFLEKKVSAAYVGANPSLVIVSTGVFPVEVQGEVSSSQILTAWGLTRLSELVRALVTPYSSLREVAVISGSSVASGTASKTYDLFKADREGDLSQDPYLRPGDVVEV